MKSLFKKENLFIRVAIGFAAGIILGLAFPEFSAAAKPVGDWYLKILKLFITPIVFCSVFCSITGIADRRTLRKLGIRTVALYVFMFFVSSAISLAIAYGLRPGLHTGFDTAPSYEGSVTTATIGSYLKNLVPKSLTDITAAGHTLGWIIIAFIAGIIVLYLGERGKGAAGAVKKLNGWLFKLLSWFMELSPLGVCSLMAFSIAKYGSGIFNSLARYIGCCWLCCLAVFVIVMLIPTCLITGERPGTFLKACGHIALVTLSTTSSAATLPTTIRVCTKELKAPEDISSFTLPLGCTINMCGGACSFCCLAVFVSDFCGVSFSFGTLIFLVLTATVINMAAPGIPGGGVVLGASFLTILGLPIDLMGPISGVYRLLDMAFTTMNVLGDVAANHVIARWVRGRDFRESREN